MILYTTPLEAIILLILDRVRSAKLTKSSLVSELAIPEEALDEVLSSMGDLGVSLNEKGKEVSLVLSGVSRNGMKGVIQSTLSSLTINEKNFDREESLLYFLSIGKSDWDEGMSLNRIESHLMKIVKREKTIDSVLLFKKLVERGLVSLSQETLRKTIESLENKGFIELSR